MNAPYFAINTTNGELFHITIPYKSKDPVYSKYSRVVFTIYPKNITISFYINDNDSQPDKYTRIY